MGPARKLRKPSKVVSLEPGPEESSGEEAKRIDWVTTKVNSASSPEEKLKAYNEFLTGYAKSQQKAEKPSTPRAGNYTTAAAKAWARSQGWKILASEFYDARLKRHHDLALGMDLDVLLPEGRAMIQAAGKGERAEHYQRFLARGGTELATKLGLKRVIYAVFERGNPTPVQVEDWL